MRCMKATYLPDHVLRGVIVRDHEFLVSRVCLGGIYLVISRESQLISRQLRVYK